MEPTNQRLAPFPISPLLYYFWNSSIPSHFKLETLRYLKDFLGPVEVPPSPFPGVRRLRPYASNYEMGRLAALFEVTHSEIHYLTLLAFAKYEKLETSIPLDHFYYPPFPPRNSLAQENLPDGHKT